MAERTYTQAEVDSLLRAAFPLQSPAERAAILAALPSSGGGEKGDGSSRDHDHTAGIALEGSWPVAEYVEELANVLWQMARGDFSRSWSTNFRNEIRSAPNIITIAGNQLAKLAAVARSSAKQIVGESSRDEHSSSPSGEVERLTKERDDLDRKLGDCECAYGDLGDHYRSAQAALARAREGLKKNLSTLEWTVRRCIEWDKAHGELDHAITDTRDLLSTLDGEVKPNG